MIVHRQNPIRRSGAAVVEAAVVLSLVFMVLFGIFEYCRFMFFLQIATNAARDAARFAVVNVNTPSVTGTVITTDTTYPSTRPVFEVPALTTHITNHMGGADRMVRRKSANIPVFQVFPCDSTVLYTDPLTIRPKLQPDSAAVPPITTASWNNARFTERVAVRITGLYDALLPNFLFMGQSATIEMIVVMGSEG